MRPTVTDVLRDPARLDALQRLDLMDTEPEAVFDRLTALVVRLMGVQIALMSLVDDHRQFFKSACGLPQPLATVRETPLTHSLCQHVVSSAMALVVNDARTHPLVRENPAVSELRVNAYLGVPLTTPEGATLGSFCAINTKPRVWTEAEQHVLADVAALAMREIEIRAARRHILALSDTLHHEAVQRADLVRLLRRHCAGLHPTPARSATDCVLRDAFDQPVLHDLELGLEPAPTVGTNHDTSRDLLNAATVLAHSKTLSRQQTAVFNLLVRGLCTKEIAAVLNLSPRTVEVHRAKILHNLHLPSVAQLLKVILSSGLIR